MSSSGTWQGPFQYGGAFGYHTDSDYGLKHLGARYYDPTTGRFLSRDPIKDGRNWYGYCGGNPLTRADANGHAWDVVADFAGIGYDIYELVTEPSLANAGWLLADLFLLLVPFVPSRGALKLGDTFLGAVLPRLGKAGHEAVDAAELLARNYKKGKAAEELVEGVQNTSPVRAPMTGRNRIPDRFEEGKLVGEIKNVDKLYKTAQMSDLLDIAKAYGVPLTLWTELSKSLQDLINRGEIIHFRRPFPNRFQGGMW
ncbi:MAG: hypothetical protein KatS3mg015_2732 [Fimbriimonadales bacterium]|nr:MAG: hypothetical protein KatS3mg015_2732 [Fimbriimonadales bacterium]